jgi:hypothetical protein
MSVFFVGIDAVEGAPGRPARRVRRRQSAKRSLACRRAVQSSFKLFDDGGLGMTRGDAGSGQSGLRVFLVSSGLRGASPRRLACRPMRSSSSWDCVSTPTSVPATYPPLARRRPQRIRPGCRRRLPRFRASAAADGRRCSRPACRRRRQRRRARGRCAGRPRARAALSGARTP